MNRDRPFEFREATRTNLEAPIVVSVAGGDEVLVKTANVSFGGCFVAMRTPPPVGTSVRLALDLEGHAVNAFAEVVWIRLSSKSLDQPVGMGLQFRHFIDDGLEILSSYLP